jgi:hypothetical protein
MSLRNLAETTPGADILRETIGFAAERSIELEVGLTPALRFADRLVQRTRKSPLAQSGSPRTSLPLDRPGLSGRVDDRGRAGSIGMRRGRVARGDWPHVLSRRVRDDILVDRGCAASSKRRERCSREHLIDTRARMKGAVTDIGGRRSLKHLHARFRRLNTNPTDSRASNPGSFYP